MFGAEAILHPTLGGWLQKKDRTLNILPSPIRACAFFHANKIDDHGGPRGDMEKILAQWRHPMASSKALDLLHWAMHTA